VSRRCYTVATFAPVTDLVRDRFYLVGVAGFEPTAPRSQSECATKLRHTPVHRMVPSAAYATSRIACQPPLAATTNRAAGTLGVPHSGGVCGRSSMAEPQPSKLAMRVRFPSPAPPSGAKSGLVPAADLQKPPGNAPAVSLTRAMQATTAARVVDLSSPITGTTECSPHFDQRHAPRQQIIA
jgi:hypothetical protein